MATTTSGLVPASFLYLDAGAVHDSDAIPASDTIHLSASCAARWSHRSVSRPALVLGMVLLFITHARLEFMLRCDAIDVAQLMCIFFSP